MNYIYPAKKEESTISTKFIKMCIHDFKEGIWRRKSFFILPFFVVTIACIKLYNLVSSASAADLYEGETSVMDYWIYIIQGREPYVFNIYTLYEVPIIWVLVYAFLFVSLVTYPVQDMQKWGYQMIIRSGNRKNWWCAKCVWCVLYVLLYYAVCFVTVMLFSFMNGINFSIRPSDYVMENYCLETFAKCSDIRLIIITLLQPILLSVLLGILQLVISLKGSPVLSFGIVFTIIMLSAYKQSWLLIGNIGMPYRIDKINEGGLDSNISLLVAFSGIFVCLMVGYYIFKKQDILG